MKWGELLQLAQDPLYPRAKERLDRVYDILEITGHKPDNEQDLLEAVENYIRGQDLDEEIPEQQTRFLAVLQELQIVTPRMSIGQLGEQYNALLEANGSIDPLWVISPDYPLPEGLVLQDGRIGRVTGDPVEAGVTTCRIMLVDQATNWHIQKDFQITILPARRRINLPDLAGLRRLMPRGSAVKWLLAVVISVVVAIVFSYAITQWMRNAAYVILVFGIVLVLIMRIDDQRRIKQLETKLEELGE